MSRTISDGSVDLDEFPASRVCQLAKKLESSKATVRHIRQVSREPQATQINLLYHQRTKLPQHRYKKKRSHTKPKLGNNKPCENDQYHGPTHYKNKGDHKPPISNRQPPSNNFSRCSKCGAIAHHEGFTCPLRSTNARHAINSHILLVNVSKGNNIHNINLDNPKLTKYKWMIPMTTQTVTHQILVPVKTLSVCKRE